MTSEDVFRSPLCVRRALLTGRTNLIAAGSDSKSDFNRHIAARAVAYSQSGASLVEDPFAGLNITSAAPRSATLRAGDMPLEVPDALFRNPAAAPNGTVAPAHVPHSCYNWLIWGLMVLGRGLMEIVAFLLLSCLICWALGLCSV